MKSNLTLRQLVPESEVSENFKKNDQFGLKIGGRELFPESEVSENFKKNDQFGLKI